jgi:hypothetical protein
MEVNITVATEQTAGATAIRPFQFQRGNHFAAWQEPQLFSEELRAAFRSLRNEGRPS